MNRTTPRRLAGEWSVLVSNAGAWATPSDIPATARRLPAPVPGTVAQALEVAGRFDRTMPVHLNDRDFWYLSRLEGEKPGPVVLGFEGLATVAEVWLNEERILTSDSMFVRHDVTVQLQGDDALAICFRALDPHLARSGPRARWRPQMITPPGLRLVRTTLLGHMPGWCPEIDAIGPYRPITISREADFSVDELAIQGGLAEDGKGVLDVSFVFSGRASDLKIACAGWTAPVMISESGRLTARMTLPNIKPWWPNGHGEPHLYEVFLVIDETHHRLGRTGFRTISIDRDADGAGFGLRVNGEPVFCRGAVWTNADIVNLPGERQGYRHFLELAAGANMNMIRIGGTMTYETADFFALCDELGLMVWQDFMLANFDYPASDPAFVESIAREAEDLLKSLQGSPSLAVLCGGSEMYQQSAMLGLSEKHWSGPLTEDVLSAISARLRPDVIYVPNSPFGGAMPFSPDTAVTHYYGVGAYCRPLDDARRANIRFASECLAFAHVPEQATLDEYLPVPAVHDPRWKARVPRDRGASWDFEDIRDHYLGLLHDVDPTRLRREDPIRYLDLSRAVSGEVSEATFAEWRRPGSTARGGLVWTLQDLLPGAGWGIIDATGRPKPVWHYLRRAFRPLQLVLTDEGTNGLDVHVINDGPDDLDLVLDLVALKAGGQKVVGGETEIRLAARSARTVRATALFGAFFDTTYAFGFGPPAHDVTVARLAMAGTIMAEAFHFPLGQAKAVHAPTLTAGLERDEAGWLVRIDTDRLAQSVHFAIDSHLPDDNWFHLAPGRQKLVRLAPYPGIDPDTRPSGEITSLSGGQVIRF